MTAKVAAFVGSPRKGGNTDLLAQAVLDGAKGAGADASVFYLYDYEIHDCRAVTLSPNSRRMICRVVP